jgi:hypothetical protein
MRVTKKSLWLLLVALWLILPLASAQPQESQHSLDDSNLLGVESDTRSFSLLDPQRLRMQHSYTFSYFTSSRFSGSLGVYTTTLNYRLSKPLSLTLSLNYLHQPLSAFRQDNLRIRNDILPNFQLHYQPNNNFSLWINVVTFPSTYGWGQENLWRDRER